MAITAGDIADVKIEMARAVRGDPRITSAQCFENVSVMVERFSQSSPGDDKIKPLCREFTSNAAEVVKTQSIFPADDQQSWVKAITRMEAVVTKEAPELQVELHALKQVLELN